MNKLIQISLVCYVSLVLINSLLLPPINFVSIDNLLFPLAFIAVVYLYFKDLAFKWSIVIASLSLITALTSNYFSGGISTQEILWTLRIVKLITVGWSVYYLVNNHMRIFKSLLFFSFIGFIIINALQLLEWNFILDLYSSNQSNIDALNNSYLDGRIFGVSTNPNSNALILALFGFYFFMSNESNKYYLMLLTVALLLMTQSRTVFIAFAVSLFAAFVIKFINKGRKQLLLFLVITTISFLFIFNLKLTNLSSLFNGTAYKSNSISTRFEAINAVLDVNTLTPLFGKGKLSNIPDLIGRSIDNEYIYLYLEYGLIGLLVLLITVLFLSIIALKINKYNLGLLFIMIICGLTNLTFSNLEVSAIFILLFSASMLNKNKVEDQQQTE